MRKRIGITYTRTNFDNYLNWFSSESDEIDIVRLNFEQNNQEDISRSFDLPYLIGKYPGMAI